MNGGVPSIRIEAFTQINCCMNFPFKYTIALQASLLLICISCNNNASDEDKKQRSAQPADRSVQDAIRTLLSETNARTNKADDSTRFYALPVLNYYYQSNDYTTVWSNHKKWTSLTDSLLAYLEHCETDGLFKEDYQFALLQSIKPNIIKDSLQKNNWRQWARADLIFTDAFIHLIQDLKQGRLQADSFCWKYNRDKYESFFKVYLDKITAGESMSSIIPSLQPSVKEYTALKKTLPAFINSMDKQKYTYLQYPYKDSVLFIKKLVKRLYENAVAPAPVLKLDSFSLSHLIIKYQKIKGLKANGKLSAQLVALLNNTDQEKLKRIAITLDKYKKLPARLPEKYIWVNLPSYNMQVWDNDSLAMQSKIIIGKPHTPTPHITSEISDLVIYPTWTVPISIIVKDILPGLKRNPGYLARKGLGLFNSKGDMVDPYSVNWAKYTKGIPYFVRQNSGDNNALGVIKFNFNNPHAVYLHDTNQRYLFKNKQRSLSHGCVRVQEWEKLVSYIAKNDSIYTPSTDTIKLTKDSIMSWIAQKENRRVVVRKPLPLFIRYFSCEGINGNIIFYEDVYGEDKVLREKYFALK
jgi:L,D-transpeptidase YcbB